MKKQMVWKRMEDVVLNRSEEEDQSKYDPFKHTEGKEC